MDLTWILHGFNRATNEMKSERTISIDGNWRQEQESKHYVRFSPFSCRRAFWGAADRNAIRL